MVPLPVRRFGGPCKRSDDRLLAQPSAGRGNSHSGMTPGLARHFNGRVRGETRSAKRSAAQRTLHQRQFGQRLSGSSCGQTYSNKLARGGRLERGLVFIRTRSPTAARRAGVRALTAPVSVL